MKRLAATLNLIGCMQLQHRNGEPKEALVTFDRLLVLRQEILSKPPHSPWDRRDIAETYFNIGIARRDLKQLEEAEAAFVKSRDLREQLATELPDSPALWHDQAASYTVLGTLHAAAGKKDLAIDEYQRAIALQERLIADNPRQRRGRRDLARTSDHLARALADRGRDGEALAAFQHSRELMEKLVAEDPDNLEFRFGLCSSLDGLGLFLGDHRKAEEGAAYLRQAVTHGRFGLDRAPAIAGYRTNLGCYYRSLARLEFAAGHTAAAASAAHEEIPLFAGHGPDLFNVACDLSRCAERVGKATAELSAERKAERDRYAAWAAEALRAAAAAGFRDGDRVRKEPVFTVLQERDDFRQALAAVDNPSGPR
jgi:tetratricopeptide (TPR) repeat protein